MKTVGKILRKSNLRCLFLWVKYLISGFYRLGKILAKSLQSLRFFGEIIMIFWALTFAILAIIAGFFGIGDLEGVDPTIAQVAFVVFMVGLIVSFIRWRKPYI